MSITQITDQNTKNIPTLIWRSAETWADFNVRLANAGYKAIVIVDEDKTIDAGTYDFSNVIWTGATGAVFTPTISFSDAITLSPGTLVSQNIHWLAFAGASSHVISGPVRFTLHGGSFSGADVFFALGTAGSVINLFEDAQLLSPFNFYYFRGSAVAGSIFTFNMYDRSLVNDETAVKFPTGSLNVQLNRSAGSVIGGSPFSGAAVTHNLKAAADATLYNDSAALPALGFSDVQGAVDAIKSTYARPVASVDLTAQSAAIVATTAYSVPASGAGMYRISWVAKVTTPASISSVLGGAALGLQVIYTDADDSVVATTQANLSGATNAGNTTADTAEGVIIVSAAASTDIQFQIGYTSAGTAMEYNLHIKVEAL